MTTLYEKVGRRYLPVADTKAVDGLGNGHWPVTVEDGWTSCRRLVEPDRAGFEAAAEVARRPMLDALREASDVRPRETKLTARERKAFRAWKQIMGEDSMWLTRDSAWDIVEKGIEAVRKAKRGRG